MRAPHRPLLRVAALLATLGGCASSLSGERETILAPSPVPPDVHGEPLALLPPAPAFALRADLTALRASPHWLPLRDLLLDQLGGDLRTLQRELGFDLFDAGAALALGMYAPPPGRTDATAWPVLYVRGTFQREPILASARARARADDPLLERSESGLQFWATHRRAYAFPAPDVLLLFDPSMTRRVALRLAGREPGSAAHDERFDALWSQLGSEGAGTLSVRSDLAQLRAAGAVRLPTRAQGAQGLQRMVLRLDAAEAVALHAAGVAVDEAHAREVTAGIEAVRRPLAERFEVRLLGLSRLLEQGVSAVDEGTLVRLSIEARPNEVHSLLRAAAFLRRFGELQLGAPAQ